MIPASTMSERTAQDLLAERRANVVERERSSDAVERSLLACHIQQIDAELRRRDPRSPAPEFFE